MRCESCGCELFYLMTYVVVQCNNCHYMFDRIAHDFPEPDVEVGEIWDTRKNKNRYFELDHFPERNNETCSICGSHRHYSKDHEKCLTCGSFGHSTLNHKELDDSETCFICGSKYHLTKYHNLFSK